MLGCDTLSARYSLPEVGGMLILIPLLVCCSLLLLEISSKSTFDPSKIPRHLLILIDTLLMLVRCILGVFTLLVDSNLSWSERVVLAV